MSPPPRSVWLRLGALLVVQTVALGWMVYERAHLLTTGTPVRLAVVPVDPRDLFRGDYVVLNYELSTLRPDELGGGSFSAGDDIWVLLEQPQEGPARAVGLSDRPPDALAIRGRVRSAFDRDWSNEGCEPPCRTIQVDYGIEQYFVPEGHGRELETLRDGMRVEIVAALAPSGKAAIARLLVDGEERYQEPLF